MLFANESTGRAELHRNTLRERLLGRTSGWTLRPLSGAVRPAIGVSGYLALYFLFQAIGSDFHLLPQEWSLNLAAGLSFGFLMAFGPAYVPAVLFAYLIPHFVDGSTAVTVWPVIVFAVGHTAVLGLASYIARRVVTNEVNLEDRRTLVIILALIPVTALVTALASILNWWLAGALVPNLFAQTLLIKSFGNGMGLLLVGPFVLLNGMPLLDSTVNRSNPLGMFTTGQLVQGAVLLHLAAGSVVAVGVVGVDRFDAYLLLFAPLIAMSLKFGLQGLAASFLVVACTQAVMMSLGYTTLDGLLVGTTILAALIGNLIVAVLATERTRAIHTVRRQASLIVDAVRTQEDAFETREQEKDLRAVLQYLVKEVEVAGDLYGIESQDDDSEAEHERLLARLEALIHDRDPGDETGGVAGRGEQNSTSPGKGRRVSDSRKDETVSASMFP